MSLFILQGKKSFSIFFLIVVGFLLCALPFAFSANFDSLRAILVETDSAIVAKYDSKLQECRSVESSKLSAANYFKALTINPVISQISTTDNQINSLNATIQQKLEWIHNEENPITKEKELIESIKNIVEQLSDSDKKNSIIELLEAILERILTEEYIQKRREQEYNARVLPLKYELAKKQAFKEDKESELNGLVEYHELLENFYHSKKEECDDLEIFITNLLEQMKERYSGLMSARYGAPVPDGRMFAVGQLYGNGIIRTFDGLNLTIEEPGNYILAQTPDRSLVVEAELVRVKYSTESQESCENCVTAKRIAVRFNAPSYGEHSIQYLANVANPNHWRYNGANLDLGPGNRYSNDGVFMSHSTDGTIYIDLPTRGYLKLHRHPETFGHDVSIILPRNLYFESVAGIFGNFDDRYNNDLQFMDGSSTIKLAEVPYFYNSWNPHLSNESQSIFGTVPDTEAVVELNPEQVEARLTEAEQEWTTFLRSSSLGNSGYLCTASLDPHYNSFDGRRFTFNGQGDYLFARSSAGEFEVQARNYVWGRGSSTGVLAIRYLSDILIVHQRSQRFNGVSVGTRWNQNGWSMSGRDITLPNGVFIRTRAVSSRYMNVWLYIPPFMFNRINSHSLCGNFDLLSQNDRTSGVSIPSGENMFASSFQYEEPVPCDPDPVKAREACEEVRIPEPYLSDCIEDVEFVCNYDEVPQLHREAYEDDLGIKRELIDIEPILHLTFDSEFDQDEQGSGINGASIDVSNNHLVLPDIDSNAMYKIDQSVDNKMITISTWLKVAQVTQHNSAEPLVRHYDPETEETYWSIGLKDNNAFHTYDVVFQAGSATASVSIPKRTWSHVTVVYNGQVGELEIYVDQIRRVFEVVESGFPETRNDSSLVFGEGSFISKIKDFRVYGSILRSYHVSDLYSQSYRQYIREAQSIQNFIESMEEYLDYHFKYTQDQLNAEDEIQSGFRNQITEHEAKIVEFKEQIQQHETIINNLDSEIQLLEQNITSQDDKISLIQETCVNIHINHKSDVSVELALVRKIMQYVQDHKDLRESRDENQHEESSDIMQMLQKIETRILGTISNIDEEIDECNSMIDSVNSLKLNINNAIGSLESDQSIEQGHINSINSKISNENMQISALDDEIESSNNKKESLLQEYQQWKSQQEAIINEAKNMLNSNINSWMDGGSYIASQIVDFTHGDSVKLLNIFEHLEYDKFDDLKPLLVRVKGSTSENRAESIVAPLTSPFSVHLHPEKWSQIRESVRELFALVCMNKDCTSVAAISFKIAGAHDFCFSLPEDITQPEIYKTSKDCTNSQAIDLAQIGASNDPTLIHVNSSPNIISKWMDSNTISAERLVVFARIGEHSVPTCDIPTDLKIPKGDSHQICVAGTSCESPICHDEDGNKVQIVSVSQSDADAVVATINSDGYLVIHTRNDFSGSHSIHLEVSNGWNNYQTQINFEVFNNPPVAIDQAVDAFWLDVFETKGQPIVLLNLLNNAYDMDGDRISFVRLQSPNLQDLIISEDGSSMYTNHQEGKGNFKIEVNHQGFVSIRALPTGSEYITDGLPEQVSVNYVLTDDDPVMPMQSLASITLNMGLCRNNPAFCPMPVDVVFMVDSSQGVSSSGWQEILEFVESFVHQMDVGPDKSHVGVAQLAERPRPIGITSDKQRLLADIGGFRQDSGWRDTSAGLQHADSMLQSQGRPGVPSVLFVITAGPAHRGDPPGILAQQMLDSHQTQIYVIGVGPLVNQQEMRSMVSSPTSDYVINTEWGNMQSLLQVL